MPGGLLEDEQLLAKWQAELPDISSVRQHHRLCPHQTRPSDCGNMPSITSRTHLRRRVFLTGEMEPHSASLAVQASFVKATVPIA